MIHYFANLSVARARTTFDLEYASPLEDYDFAKFLWYSLTTALF